MVKKWSIRTCAWALLIGMWLLPGFITAQNDRDFWQISDRGSIVWSVGKHGQLPHTENIEMAGKQVAAIIYYAIDSSQNLQLSRDVIFPQLRTYNKYDEPDWKKYRAYFRRTVADEVMPSIHLNDKVIRPSRVDSVEIGGWLRFHHTPLEGLKITRMLYPSLEGRFFVEEWQLINLSDQVLSIDLTHNLWSQSEMGYKGLYTFHAYGDRTEKVQLAQGESMTFPVYFGATLNEESSQFNAEEAWDQRQSFLDEMRSGLELITPDPVINQLFYFSKIRASESIFKSSMGLIHSPGGGNYYVGTWANDQVEYSGPFFPYLGYQVGNEAAFNTYQKFKAHIPAGDGHIPYAFEVDGNFTMDFLDRGDAAMIAYGTSKYLLARGDLDEMRTLWPLVEWSLKYCHEHRNSAGAVMSESDEMEGRISTGKANLSTSSLYYGGLKYATRLAGIMNQNKLAGQYQKRAKAMEKVIEQYFGARMEGLDTYRYFDGNEYLRHWICLPLVMGITNRQEATLSALFEHLWTENGVLVEKKPDSKINMFWDRATLYALRGAFRVGETELAFEKLKDYSRKRLLGDHVPYAIEAYPENNMKHLSAESALYCRIITEGMLGIEPVAYRSFQLTPALPAEWDFLELKSLSLFGKSTDLSLQRIDNKILVEVMLDGETILKKQVAEGKEVLVQLPN
ncbi:MAG: hypothetical protein R8G66_16295 [Cytophagales bacterium]|nr:hypothetical protein [Cytophagales bacterium]